MKRAAIYVFSGTGNTRAAADMVARALGAHEIQTDVFDIRLPYDTPRTEDYDIVGIAYPIHAFNAPRIVRDFVRTFPKDEGKRVFFFKTSGEPFALNSSSSYFIARILEKKGFINSYDMHMLMPYNIMFRYRDPLAKQMYLHTKRMAKLLAKRIAEGRFETPRYKAFYTCIAAALRLQWLGADINSRLLSVKKDRCVQCMKCVKECPSGNISLKNGKLFFDGRCTMCMHCVMLCPEDAVRAGILQLWKVNGAYPFEDLERDEAVSCVYIDEDTKGYFKLFRKYYRKTYAELEKENL